MNITKTYFYIYEITNQINGKTYIGQHTTKDLNDGYLGSGLHLLRAMKKYGRNNFKKEILMFAVNGVALNFIEKCLVTLDFTISDDNYNIQGGGNQNYEISDETRQKMSVAKKGKPLKPEHAAKIKRGFLGKTHSLEARLKMSLASKGKKKSLEHIKKNRLANLGKKHSEETKKRMADKQKERRLRIKQICGAGVSEETRLKMVEAWKLRKLNKNLI